MEMIDMSKGKKTVQRSINRSCYGVVPKRAQRVHLHHLVFEFHSAVSPRRGMQLVEIQIRETCTLNASEVSAAPLNPHDCCFVPVERIQLLDFRAGVPTAKIRNAQIRSQQVGPVAQKFRFVEALGNPIVPAIFEEL